MPAEHSRRPAAFADLFQRPAKLDSRTRRDRVSQPSITPPSFSTLGRLLDRLDRLQLVGPHFAPNR